MQVTNDLALAEWFNIDRAKRNFSGLQGAYDFRQMGPGTNQDRNALSGTLLTRTRGNSGDTRAFRFAIFDPVQMHSVQIGLARRA